MSAPKVFSGNLESIVQLNKVTNPRYNFKNWISIYIEFRTWVDLSRQRYFMDLIAKKLNITDKHDWYKVTANTLRKHKVGGLLASKYNNSPSKLLSTVYPEYLNLWYYIYLILSIYKWDLTNFTTAPMNFWDNVSNQKVFLDNLSKKLNIKHVHDWFRITTTKFQAKGGSTLLRKYNGSLGNMLATVYPEYKQTCRDISFQLLHELKLKTLQELCHISKVYPI